MNSKTTLTKRKNVLAAMVGLFAAAGGASSAMAQGDEAATAQGRIDEIIVTATKRETSLQDTAMSISVLGGEEIGKKGLLSGSDFLTTIPNVSFYDLGPGVIQKIVMRGLATNTFSGSATAVSYLGEVPLTDVYQNLALDMKLVDMDRVEVLRGPQGTLFGGGSLAGAVRNIPVAPKLDNTEVILETGFSTPSHSNDLGNKLVGIVNIPLVEGELALRVAAYRYDNPGYIDRISTPDAEQRAIVTGGMVEVAEDVNSSTYTGGRASLLWQAMDKLSLTATLATQKIEVDGDPVINPLLNGWNDSGFTSINHPKRPQFNDTNIASLVVEYDLDWSTLTLSTGYVDFDGEKSTDLSANVSTWAATTSTMRSKKLNTHELRLSSNSEGSLGYLVGLYYEDYEFESVSPLTWDGSLAGLAASGLGPNTEFALFSLDTTAKQKAVFGEVSYSFNDEWAATLGGRRFEYDRRDLINFVPGARFGVNPRAGVDHPTDEQGDIYKANIAYTPNEDILIYMQYSQGFRIGEGQALPVQQTCDVDNDGILDGSAFRLTNKILSDTTDNYELGAKLSLIDQRLTLSAVLFEVDWEGIPIRGQITGTDGAPCRVTNNAGNATSQGLEFEARFQATPNFLVSLVTGFTEAEFTENNNLGNKGDDLIMAPHWNANLGLEYNFDLVGRPAFVQADYNYVDNYHFYLGDAKEGGGYGRLNFRTGLNVNEFDIAVYATNMMDEDALIMREVPGRGWNLPPRIIGVEITYQF